MRNLKKFLALVLAMMMAMSLMVTANASQVIKHKDYADSVDQFTTAVDVLSGMGIFKGDQNNNFNPDQTITRAEMAALIYRLKTGDVNDDRAGLYTEFGNFPDVDKNNAWYAGYVGFCANGEIIKGRADGRFDPSAKVTGYEALAMMLRAVGYDRNNEFTGAGWETQVAAYASRFHVTDEVKTTIYGSNLYGAARRDVIASMLFRAAQLNQVTWSQMTGYTDGKIGVNFGSNTDNSLASENFQLTENRGIVVANQATNGGNSTTLSMDRDAIGLLTYLDRNTVNLNFVTGLEEFGHQFHVYYRNAGGIKQVYAAYDEVSSSKLVLVKGDDGDLDGTLGQVAADAGYNVGAKAHLSAAFKPFSELGAFTNIGDENVDWRGNTIHDSSNADRLYLLISNAGSNLNAVVALNVAATAITGVDLITNPNTVSVPYVNNNSDVFVEDYNSTMHGALANVGLTGVSSVNRVSIKQSALTNGTAATKALGDYVIANAIGNGAAKATVGGVDAYGACSVNNYSLSKVKSEVVKIVGYHTNTYASRSQADLLSNPDYLVTDKATTIKKSMLYYTVAPGSIPQQGSDAFAQDTYNTSTYRVFLDGNGDYIGAEPVRGEEFLYATYIDYNQATSTGAFEYFATGVNEKGEKVTKTFTTHNITPMSGIYGIDKLGVPYHDFNNYSGTGTGIGSGRYKGFALSGTAMCDKANASGLVPATLGWHDTPALTAGGNIVVDTNSVAIGAVLFDNNATLGNLYLTERTQFYIVSGNGTSNLDVKPVKGITALLNGQSRVTIDITGDPYNVSESTGYAPEIFFNVFNEAYANTLEINAREVDTVFIPARAVSGMSTSIFFAPYAYSFMQDIGNSSYQKFVLYQGGEQVERWLDVSNAADIPTAGAFYETIRETGLRTSSGEPVYKMLTSDIITPNEQSPATATEVYGAHGAVETDDSGIQYWPTTTNSQVAVMGVYGTGKMINVANAKIVNLSRTELPNLNNNDLAGLNAIASNAYLSGANDKAVRVWVQLDSPNGNVATVIYVSGIGSY